MDRCPKCGGTSGYRFERIERSEYVGRWDGNNEYGDSTTVLRELSPQCLDCGQAMRWSTVRTPTPEAAQK